MHYPAVLLLLLSCMSLRAAEPLFLSDQNRASKRFVILEELGGSACMYLSEPGIPKPEKDAFVYSMDEPVAATDWSEVEKGAPPRLSKEFASEHAVIRDARAEDFAFTWADDGESVALQHKGRVIAMIVREEKRGYSAALSKSGPLGHPLDPEKAKRFE